MSLALDLLFSDGMMLQREMDVPVWGTAEPGEKVAVSLQGVSASALADAEGAWRCELPPLAASDSETLVAQGADERIEVHDVAVGEELDIHPKNKLVPGHRLALLALQYLYGRDILADAPRCTGTVVDGRTIVLSFDNAGEGLAIVGEPISALELVCDGQSLPYAASVSGSELVITLDSPPQDAIDIRFAQGNWHVINLVNSAGIPALPFASTILNQ